MIPPIVLVGRGRVGRTLARRLAERGVDVTLVPGRVERWRKTTRAALVGAGLVWIAVPDPFLAQTEAHLAQLFAEPSAESSRKRRARPIVAHASGAMPLGVLARCAEVGCLVASAHPIVSFGTLDTRLEDTTFALDGAPRATRTLARVVRLLGARPLVRSVHGPRYHAALALAANGTTALALAATEILVASVEGAGLTEDEASRALAGLLRSVADNVARVGAARALTGPIARGDAVAVARHLDALGRGERAAYVAVAALVLDAARAQGLSAERARAIEAVLAPR